MQIRVAATSHIGLVRKKNEDSFYLDEENCVFAVADGLGGLPFGDLASQAAMNYLEHWVRVQKESNFVSVHWGSLIKMMNQEVIDTGTREGGGLGIGSTLSMGMILDGNLETSHIGDSRIYLFRDGNMTALTEDHTLETFAIKQGQIAPGAEVPEHYKHTLTQCLGQRQLIKPDFETVELQTGDRILFCTDGIYGYIDLDYMRRLISLDETPEDILGEIIDAVLENGAGDNATGLLLFIK